MLRAHGVTKSYGDIHALRGVDLEVEAGQIVSLLGRNGAGKSTFLSIVAGLIEPDKGTVHIDDVSRSNNPNEAAKRVGIAPQETGVYQVLTVRENLEFFGELVGMGKADRRGRAEEVSAALGLKHLLDRKASQLSGGEVRRLHTACALLHRPKLLLLDEPTVGADVETRGLLIEAVRALADDGAAVIYTTHYLPEVEALEADIVVIEGGEVLARGNQRQLIQDHSIAGVTFTVEEKLPDPVVESLAVLGTIEVLDAGRGSSSAAVTSYRLAGEASISDAIGHLGANVSGLRSIERSNPNLEEVFLAITGERMGEAAPAAEHGGLSTAAVAGVGGAGNECVSRSNQTSAPPTQTRPGVPYCHVWHALGGDAATQEDDGRFAAIQRLCWRHWS